MGNDPADWQQYADSAALGDNQQAKCIAKLLIDVRFQTITRSLNADGIEKWLVFGMEEIKRAHQQHNIPTLKGDTS